MTSNYGDSVKFYEKMAELHGQLKSYEEEQYHLQEEFTKLWPNSPRNREPPLLRTDGSMQEKVLNTTAATATTTTTTFLSLPSSPIKPDLPTISVDDISGDEKRRKRNQAIVDKIKDLEANAAVFAARSERLRIMRGEYDMLVKKYVDNRKVNVNPAPTLSSALNQRFAPISTKICVTVGINTDITGPVKPTTEVLTSSQFNYFESAPAQTQSHNGHGPPTAITSYVDSTLKYTDFLLTQSKNLQFQTENQNNNGRFQSEPKLSTQSQCKQGIEEYMNVYSASNNNKPTNQQILSSSASGRCIENAHNNNNAKNNAADDNLLGSNAFHNTNMNVTAADKDKEKGKKGRGNDINIDTDDSMTEKYRYRHNSFFDMSTTSESDLTSAQNILQKKKSPMMVPININLDDSTQSDTFSLSMSMSVQTPHGRKVKPSLNTAQVVSSILTTDGSESTTSHQSRKYKDPSALPLSQYLQENQSESLFPARGTLMMAQKENETISLGGEERMKRKEEYRNPLTNDLEIENNDENDLESSLSESLTTSPNDSVMDSVQNRTLNDSLPHDNDNVDNDQQRLSQSQEELTNERLLNPLRIPTIPSFNLPAAVKGVGMKEMRQQEEKEEDERKSVSSNVEIVEDHSKSKNETVPVQDSKNTIVTNSLPFKHDKNFLLSHLNPDGPKSEKTPATPSTSARPNDPPRDQKQPSSSNFDYFDTTKIMSPLDVLNSFKKIEQEFIVENEMMMDQLEAQSWERNTISLENKTSNNTDTGGQAEQVESFREEKDVVSETKGAAVNEKPAQPPTREQSPSSSKVSSGPSPIVTMNRPKTAASSTGSVGPPRRVKIKLDYEDSDSDGSDPAPIPTRPNNSLNANPSSGNVEPNKDNFNEVDDDFDDFFDI